MYFMYSLKVADFLEPGVNWLETEWWVDPRTGLWRASRSFDGTTATGRLPCREPLLHRCEGGSLNSRDSRVYGSGGDTEIRAVETIS